jgi:diadenosine tetraphosphate (Ap4A) HIT family hydrolase
VACIASKSVIEGNPVLVVVHYEDDHSWAFTDGEAFDPGEAMVVAMSTVISLHPELEEISDLAAGWSATRTAVGQPWSKAPEDWSGTD